MKDIQIKITFNKSTSMNYEKVLRISKKFNNFSPISEENLINEITLDSSELFEKWRAIQKLIEIISGWKGAEIFINDDEVDFYEFRHQFNSLIECYQRYLHNHNQPTYCSMSYYDEKELNWGCRLLNDISLNLNSGYYGYSNTKWYEYGSFKDENTWEIDKKALRSALDEEVKRKNIDKCPAFSFENVERKVNELPNEIDLEDNKHWKKTYRENIYGSNSALEPTGIEYVDEYRSGLISIDLIGDKEEETQKTKNIPDVTFKDIGGIENTIQTIREVIELPLKHPELLDHIGIKPHKGILLYGPPGNGKTLIAKAIANDVNAHFIPVSASELINKYMGQSEENLRETFKEARNFKPSIIYFDEIDAVALKRDESEHSKMMSGFLNQLLTLMDGMESNDNVVVIASTNRPELLDKALLRPGRFDYQIRIGNPDLDGIKKIFKINSSKMPLEENLDIDKFCDKLVGLSGAEVTFVCKEAGYNALRRSIDLEKVISNEQSEYDFSKIKLGIDDFELALEKVISQRDGMDIL